MSMGSQPEDFLIFAVACLSTSASVSALLILCFRLIDRAWPDADTVLFSVKLFFGIGTLALVFGLVVEFL
jgi:hypothetical protein